MPYKIFTIQAMLPQDDEDELNAFLLSHRVLQVLSGFVQSPSPCWSLLVEYVNTDAHSNVTLEPLY